MASASRFKKRVFPFRRAPNGSAFFNCEACGMSVAVALADMHYCESNMEVKRFKGMDTMRNLPINNQQFKNEPISPYRLFMESFMKDHWMDNYIDIEVDRIGFEKWKNMSYEEKQPYVSHARELDSKHEQALKQEAEAIIKVKDGAESTKVKKVDKPQWIFIESSEDSRICSILTQKICYSMIWNDGV